MAISKAAPDIGLRLVGMADGSTAIATERGELLANQCGVVLKSSPGGATIATVEFVIDHDKFKLNAGSAALEIKNDRYWLSGFEAAVLKEIKKIRERLNSPTW